uniref:Uncharacterized protein n=1 Tax=Panagrolaimus sp. ES5 TaxID=591445 RepID=A0AC34FML9_9BILA
MSSSWTIVPSKKRNKNLPQKNQEQNKQELNINKSATSSSDQRRDVENGIENKDVDESLLNKESSPAPKRYTDEDDKGQTSSTKYKGINDNGSLNNVCKSNDTKERNLANKSMDNKRSGEQPRAATQKTKEPAEWTEIVKKEKKQP